MEPSMDDFGVFARDFGYKPQGKSAPIAQSKTTSAGKLKNSVNGNLNFGMNKNLGSNGGDSGDDLLFNDVFGGPPKYTSSSSDKRGGIGGSDKPVYDDDDHLLRVNNSSTSSAKFDNVFASNSDAFDDLLGGLGQKETEPKSAREKVEKDAPGFDGLLPGFGGSSGAPSAKRQTSESRRSQKPPSNSTTSSVMEDPFIVPESTSTTVYSTDFRRSVGQTTSPLYETNTQVDISPRSQENLETCNDVWLTVSEIPLFTQPTSAPPPSRPPPPRPARVSKLGTRSFGSTNSKNKVNGFHSVLNSTQYTHSPKSVHAAARSPRGSEIDELEDFSLGKTRINNNDHANVLFGEEVDSNSVAAAAAMKDAMDRAEAKFRHAKEVREREQLKAARSKEAVLDKDEQDRSDNERQKREKEEEEREQMRIVREREEEREKEQRRLEKEWERARERERERVNARQAVERATREARGRAAAEARLKAEKAAVEKANAEVRERAERAAVQRIQAEARERAAVEARERAEKAAAEAQEREARERASVSRAEAEVRQRAERAAAERAAAEARERAAAAARAYQQKTDNDLESFFSSGSRPSSSMRPSVSTSDSMFDTQAQSKGRPEVDKRTSVGPSSNNSKTSSATNIVDDLTSFFGAVPSAGNFQEVDGESEERRRSRLERHQRTQERAAKALAEKSQRDLQAQRDQAERHRFAETLDAEIKRWAAGKVGNLRALLSTLQYVLWPESGWQPVSLTDLITAAAVKKVYRKATLCVHPDKVQQKGANLQQKYVAEKVFDLLKEAWNKFNSEELF